ncbi:tRNA (guanine(6)-N2)-methyltransferase THUMP3-like [Hydractinia symbiolongicarpus]|uniref:tRNA (guanine(6)-N2)-methyltransferase THUMP3-like n=1 Tax=Hydractinia symbiolongicarpus TaxID=13093 RepID=UPI00254DE5A4|nr:tRNA (guanine(6)-N2)-methyltransferase THUMP3-like [Hydractinia symbiolongicarpus]
MDEAETVTIICSCIPGFETVVLAECKEKLGIQASKDIRGRIKLDISMADILKLLNLRSVHHYYVVVEHIDEFLNGSETQEELVSKFAALSGNVNWEKALKTWKIFKVHRQAKCKGNDKEQNANGERKKPKFDTDENVADKNYAEIDPIAAKEMLSFRVTATRTGTHQFTSMEAATHIGGGINDLLLWKVDLKHFDIEVVSNILDNSITLGVQLTKDSQSLRNITHFGPTTLKANISYCLLQLAGIQNGDIVCDPMCGGGSISIEGSISSAASFHVAGDNHEVAVQYAQDNFEAVCGGQKDLALTNFTLPFSVLRWDVYQLPLRTGCVDRIVTDLPFGKKIGSKERNVFLYPNALREMARICRPSGKAVLLTQHRQAMGRALGRTSWWKVQEKRMINMGGMNVTVYVLGRTADKYVAHDSTK